jgi:integrase
MRDVAYGDGTITKRSDGRLQVTVNVAGKRRFAMVPARLVRTDPKAARRKAEELRRELVDKREAGIEPSSQTLAVFLRSWIDGLRDARRQRVRPRTLDHYALIVERHIIPGLGKHRLDRLSERHVQAWLDGDAGSPRTVHHHRAVLRRALNVAVRHRLVERNVAVAVEMPDVEKFRGSPLTLDEARRLLSVTAGDRLSPLWWVAIDTGLRIGELLALGWNHVDLEAGTLRVEGQLQRRDGRWERTPPKAARSLDVVSLSAETVAALRRHRLEQASERLPSTPYFGLVFRTFPEALVEPCVKAGTSERGVCPDCGAPWERVTRRGVLAGQDADAARWIAKSGVSLNDLRRLGKSGAMRFDEIRLHGATRLVGGEFDALLAQRLYDTLGGWLGRCVAEACGTETTGWRASCRHDAEPVPATVLDPFAGSGTTGRVAQRLGRRAVLVDLNPTYLIQAMVRNRDIPLGLGFGSTEDAA